MSDSNIIAEYSKLLRFWNGAIAALGVLLGALVATGWDEFGQNIEQLMIGIVIVVLFVSAGNSLNDYFDIENDRTAHPTRPLVRGTINRVSALYFSVILFTICLFLTIFLNLFAAIIVILALTAMIAYELRLKASGFAGNVVIALLTAALFIFSGAIMNNAEKTILLASLAGFATLGREIVKDIEDIAGDAFRRTLPTRIGVKNAGYIAFISILAAVLLSTLPYLLDQLSVYYLYTVIWADALFIIGGILQFRNPRKGQNIFKVAMIIALAAFLAGVPT